MTLEFLTRNWALAIASVLGTAIFLFVVYRLYADSPRGRLQRLAQQLNARKRDARQAERRLEQASATLAALRAKAGSVPPRRIAKAEESEQDARMLHKVAADQVLVGQRRVRDLILEDFPPKRHDALRNKYL